MPIAAQDPSQAATALTPAQKPAPFVTQSAQDAERTGKDQFLKMLVAQLRNQDPMNPMDDKEMVQQLATFTHIEQAMETNRQLSALQGMTSSQGRTGMAALIGKDVTADAANLHFSRQSEEPIDLRWKSSGPTTQAMITITDGRDLPVRIMHLSGNEAAGGQAFWDGKDSAGANVLDGEYHVRVVTALANGQMQEVPAHLRGKAAGIGFDESGAAVMVGNVRVRPQEMNQVQMTPAPAPQASVPQPNLLAAQAAKQVPTALSNL